MLTLIADRFLRLADERTIDLATAERVIVRVEPAQCRAAQQEWSSARAAQLGVAAPATLIDFGLLGCGERFEAYRAATQESQQGTAAEAAVARQAVGQAVEWLDQAQPYSPRILCARGAGVGWLEQLAREIRLRGFISVNVSLLPGGGRSDASIRLQPEHWPLLSARAIVLLDHRDDGLESASLSLAFITLATANVHEAAAIVRVGSSGKTELCLHSGLDGDGLLPGPLRPEPLVTRAAESRGAYGDTRRARLVVDSRATALLEEASRWAARGRHAAAERTLRAALAAFDRRNDLFRAGESGMLLGRLLLERGRAAEAQSPFQLASERFRRLGNAAEAVVACVLSGLAETDDGKLEHAERTLRAAYSAAAALQSPDAVQSAAVALARNLYWQKRSADALALMEQGALEDAEGDVVRYWCLMSRLRLETGKLDQASQCAGRAREKGNSSSDPGTEGRIRLAQARIQAALGDTDALTFHVRAGLAAARAAHLPLAAAKLRVALIEGLLNAGQIARARAVAARTKLGGKAPLPALLRQRIDALAQEMTRAERSTSTRGLASPIGAPSCPIGHLDRVTELLSACHEVEDERGALNAAALAVRKQTGALAAGIFGAPEADTVDAAPFGLAGTIAAGIARRCVELTYAIRPEAGTSGVEGAVPIHHLGRTIGALACRWTIEGPRNADDVLGFMRLAAAACAPLVQIVLARDSFPLGDPADGVELVGSSAGIEDVRRLIARAANAPFTVLIEGETGAGKELVARAIHRTGCRRERPFCALNCAALTEELVDAELFGYMKGAFTGAASDRLGLFEGADKGTVFLDEVGELSARAQAKLLRVLQEGEIRRIGENFTRPIDARLIAATNRPLKAEADAARFRRDLLYRLDVIRIHVPPLRERIDDIPGLAAGFWRRATERIGSKAVLGPGALSALARYDWPGNVRELQNVLMALAVAVPARGIVSAAAMPSAIARAARPEARETLDSARRRFEARFVRAALAQSAGHRGQAAAALGVSRQGLAKLMQRLQI
ncbi:MAG TPA: sigma-54 dependent transcriptional regulator [Vicinamibacterales bacterium]|jgi:transcriptional regulator with AAA-type ATPase domain/tetratricopeptide (TPR) repeat protein|nr:sigma-54 dependent transcriptional regulator [Vicinamibacterales bacterium]